MLKFKWLWPVLFIVGGLVLITTLLLQSSGMENQEKSDPQVITKRCLGSWREVLVIRAGQKFEESTDLMGYLFQPKQPECWEFAGELVPRPLSDELHLDVNREPMRLDLLTRGRNGETRSTLGIIKFDGDCLIWVTSPNGERPKEFNSTPANNYLLRVLKRCQYLDQVTTVKD
jgi:uncharacterized protein (TIGR03067 family)